jgi:hypothetical protein
MSALARPRRQIGTKIAQLGANSGIISWARQTFFGEEAMTVKIDYGRLHGSVFETDDGPQWTDFLNRNTGEIVCFCEDAERWAGKDAAIDFVFDCARIESDPHSWIEIPKMGRWECPHTEEEQSQQEADFDTFVAKFLRENNIRAEIV